jgi:lambda family phage tail tape measure protein
MALSVQYKEQLMVPKSLGEAAAGVLRNIANRMLDIAVNMALFGSISGMGSKGGGLLGLIPGLDKRAKGGVYAQNGIQPFARGGIVNGPTLFPFAKGIGLMGEAGPEAIMPLRRGRDGNLGVMSSGGGTTNVVVNVDASGSSVEGDQQQAKALGNAISAAVQSELVKQKRPGGLLA